MTLPLAAHKIIPHRDSMLLIDALLTSEEGTGTAETTLVKNCIAVDESGMITPLIHIELIAQTYAAVKGWQIIQTGQDFPIGYLVGVQKFEALSPCKSAEQLTIHVETVGEFEGFAVVQGTVSSKETAIAQGKIKLWVPEEEAS